MADQVCVNPAKNRDGMLQDIDVGESQHVDHRFVQHARSFRVVLHGGWIRMLPAIEFNDEPTADAIKIGDVSADGDLTAEFEGGELLVSNETPKLALGIRRPVTQDSGESFEAGGLIAPTVHRTNRG